MLTYLKQFVKTTKTKTIHLSFAANIAEGDGGKHEGDGVFPSHDALALLTYLKMVMMMMITTIITTVTITASPSIITITITINHHHHQ